MKKILLPLLCISLFSCGGGENENKEESTAENKDTTAIEAEPKTEEPVIDAEKIKSDAIAYKTEIEGKSKTLTKVEMKTDKCREQIKQKWSKIEFYSENGNVVRIKTYPHDKISTRTEEYYVQDNNLVTAYISDNGIANEDGKNEDTGKWYFFSEGKPVAENNASTETEYAIKNSDGERLLQEFNEYMTLMNSNK